MADLLFIYGTLHPDRAPAPIAATARQLTLVARASVRGRLYDLGAYPGLILSADGDEAAIVPGELFAFPDGVEPNALFEEFDAYEDFQPDDPTASLFLRQQTLATLTEGEAAGSQIACWVYTYNRPL